MRPDVPDVHVADTVFTDGVWRAVYEQPDGRQYVIDDDGEPVFGIWFIPRDDADVPVIVES
jgi:hypothetical protein